MTAGAERFWRVAILAPCVIAFGGFLAGPVREGDGRERLARLLRAAFGQLAQAAPTLWAANQTGAAVAAPSEDGWFANPFESLPFPRSTPERAGGEGAAGVFRIAGPTLVAPAWVRAKGSRLSAYEKLLLDCQPGGPGALMAVLVPATFLTSRFSERTREGVARFRRPVLALYSTDPVPGVHPGFEYAAVFYRPRAGSTHPLVLFRVPPRVDLAIVTHYLRSPAARSLVNAERSSPVRLMRSELSRVRVPKPDGSLRKALTSLDEAAIQFARWQSEAADVLQEAFAGTPVRTIRARIIERGRTLRLRREAAGRLDDPSSIARTQYPYPIASRWRRADTAVSTEKSVEALREVLETAEVLLCYLALVSLALARPNGIGLGLRKSLRAKVKQGGPTFGTRRTALSQVGASQAVGALPDNHPLHDIWRAVADPDFQGRAKELNELRNSFSHLGGPDITELPEAVDRATEALKDLLRSVSFLADLRLAHVTATRWDSLAKKGKIGCRELVGDHPVVPTQSLQYDSPDVECDSLYLIDGEERLHLPRPYLTTYVCRTCRTWSTFHIARGDGSSFSLKDLEGGHTVTADALKAEGLREAFEKVDLL